MHAEEEGRHIRPVAQASAGHGPRRQGASSPGGGGGGEEEAKEGASDGMPQQLSGGWSGEAGEPAAAAATGVGRRLEEKNWATPFFKTFPCPNQVTGFAANADFNCNKFNALPGPENSVPRTSVTPSGFEMSPRRDGVAGAVGVVRMGVSRPNMQHGCNSCPRLNHGQKK